MISIIVPCKKINKLIAKDLIPALKNQNFKDFELIIVTDKLCSAGPAEKRDWGVKKSKGKVIAFIDDDAYPHKDWLKNALPYFKNKKIAAVCGPGITPDSNNLKQRVSGWVWQTWFGAGGAGTYRNKPETKRFVDDYPSFNLIVSKEFFNKVGGFNSHFWPGEDTKLCHDLVYKLGKKIIYDPKVLVYHHRREIFLPHLKQVARFGLHRGHFVKILPETSFKLRYFMPLLFILWLFLNPLILFVFVDGRQLKRIFLGIYLIPIFIYLLLLLTTSLNVYNKEKKLKLAFLIIPTIFFTHLTYGIMFIKGLLSKKLKQ